MSLKNISNYTKQLSTTINAGLPIDRVLETLTRTAPTKRLRAVSAEIKQSIGSGTTLAEAFGKHGRVFPDFFTKMIEVGETTGRLEQVTGSLSSYYEQRYVIRRTASHELLSIVLYFTVLMGLVLFIERLTGGKEALLRHVEAMEWAALGIAVIWAGYTFSRRFRDAVGSLLLHVPVLQRLVRKFCLWRFCEGMQLASEAGLDVQAAIKLSSESAGNAAFRKRALRASEFIEKGFSISEALEKTGVFPFDAMQVIAVGEETGKLHEAMGHVSKLAREQAVENLRLTLTLGIRVIYMIGVVYFAYKVVTYWAGVYRGISGL